MQHRATVTSGGRLLTVHGVHASGLRLAWRDPATPWSNATRGVAPDGTLLAGAETGDWPASIALSRDAAGAEVAWILWAADGPDTQSPLNLVKLTELDDPAGPVIATRSELPQVGYRPDVDVAPGGGLVVTYLVQVGADVFETRVARIADPDTPVLSPEHVLYSGALYDRMATLTRSPAGLRATFTDANGASVVCTEEGTWACGAAGARLRYPSAAPLPDGGVMVVGQRGDTIHTARAQRFTAAGAPVGTPLDLVGYRDPTVTADGTRAIIVMIREADGLVVSRELSLVGGWTTTDRVEVGAEGGGNHRWPNAVRALDGRLRFVVGGPRGSATNSSTAVLAFQRPL